MSLKPALGVAGSPLSLLLFVASREGERDRLFVAAIRVLLPGSRPKISVSVRFRFILLLGLVCFPPFLVAASYWLGSRGFSISRSMWVGNRDPRGPALKVDAETRGSSRLVVAFLFEVTTHLWCDLRARAVRLGLFSRLVGCLKLQFLCR